MKRMWAVIAVLIALGMLIAGCPTTPENKKPTASMTVDRPVMFIGGNATFNGTLSKDPDGKVKDYIWSFGDGSADQTVKDKTITHIFSAAGAFNVTLFVKDDKGTKSKTAASTIVVVAPLPIASASVVDTATNITFSIDNSTIGKYVTDYSWDFGDGKPIGKDASVTHAYIDNGSYKVTLTIVYKGQSASPANPLSVIVQNRPPVANISIGSVSPYFTNKPISFNGGGSGDADGTVTRYYWQFGDGTMDNGSAVTHAYTQPNNYTVTLTVTDNDNATASATMNLTVVKDLAITNVSVLIYKDDNNISRANVTVKFDNLGDAKAANTVNITVTAFKSDKSPITSGDFKKFRLFDAPIASNTKGATATLNEILVDNTSPDSTWYFVELSFGGNVIDSGWYQKS